ncbi:MAG: hypothetical protein M1833_002552 [Piccolia ochrophora]|nr:MAG: hypothetical protein M1833_002552 [Piccolia ochrophora]
MSSFFGKLRSSAGATSPTIGSTTTKKDPLATSHSSLERLLEHAGPPRNDGSDKFFGMENYGNTCYCNSILQCLYYSAPFRENVMKYPVPSPLESLKSTPNGLPRLNTASPKTSVSPTLSPTKTNGAPTPISPARRSLQGGVTSGQTGNRPEDKPDSPEYKKKQAMLAGPILSIDYENAKNHGISESLFASLKDVFEAIVAHQSRTGVVSPLKFLEILKREHEMFRSSMHQDAHEFLNLLLNEVMESVETISKLDGEPQGAMSGLGIMKPLMPILSATSATMENTTKNNTSWVHDIFEGTLTSETRCLTCENVSQRDEPFLDLSVDLDQHSSVTSCLRKFSEEEMLCERNKFHCDICNGLQEAEKRMKIKRLPKILALHLKRFKYTEDLQRLQKLFHRVVYPYHLRLFNTTDDAEDADRLYELYAVVVHIGGGPYHGHYVSIVKTEAQGWLLFDDELVEPVDKTYVRNFFGDKPGLACAYVLFYQETTLEAVQREQEAEGATASQASEPAKEGTALKSTSQAPNGQLHPAKTANAPLIEESEPLDSLDHVASAPPVPTVATLAPSPSTGPSLIPKLNTKKSDVKSKKERAEEEKKNKQADKDREKAEKQKLKELETKKKENEKKHKDDAKAAIAASKHSKLDEDGREVKESKEVSKDTANGASGAVGGSLNRFRQSSKSITRRPKFWASKDKEEPSRSSQELLHEMPIVDGQGPQREMNTIPIPPIPERLEKPKSHRFSLKKKTSSMFN